jgi:hypothetical protein
MISDGLNIFVVLFSSSVEFPREGHPPFIGSMKRLSVIRRLTLLFDLHLIVGTVSLPIL